MTRSGRYGGASLDMGAGSILDPQLPDLDHLLRLP
ncbi:hypothetical protein BFJ68_g10387 [Fusarium oxysporum]|uniref:Uncharacterized protein n=1 Tax=Fusarium oxysporum TaxID=5507 RepID=A0A420QNN2_FUSOX|nr:hypothetical protein BFJ68_g10387 [Fusarium oxysporum]